MKLPDHLVNKVEQMTTLQRLYCEFRSRNMSQSEAMLRAGSDSKDSASRGRIGYQIEQIDGAKEYIEFLKEQRAQAAGLDSVELIQYLRDIYAVAMTTGKLKEATDSVELMGRALGIFGKGGIQVLTGKLETGTKNDTQAFKEEEQESNETKERLAELQSIMRNLNTSNDKG